MDFGYSQKILDLLAKLRSFMAGLVLPNNERWHREVEAGSYPLELLDELKAQAKASRLRNLFLPGLRDDEPGTRLTNLYGPAVCCKSDVSDGGYWSCASVSGP